MCEREEGEEVKREISGKKDERRMKGWDRRKLGLEERRNKRVGKCSHVLPCEQAMSE